MQNVQPIADQKNIVTVTELTHQIKSMLQGNFPSIWVEGEISNFKVPASGHFYFSLKDETSQIRAVMWRSNNRYLKFDPTDGLSVIVKGQVTVYDAKGEYQISVNYIEPKGVGALQLKFEQLKEKLAKEGLFDTSRKKPIPFLPQKIAIVTSPKGAAIQDILAIIDRRFANVEILIYPVKVQGEGAALEIAQALHELNAFSDIDVIIVSRGGGSIEDLWAFNEEVVAWSIFVSKIPIISAVGHEIDFTIADFVADMRAPTPTGAAQIVVRNKLELLNSIEGNMIRLRNGITRQVEIKKSRLEQAVARVMSPKQRIETYRQTIDDLSEHLNFCFRNNIERLKSNLEITLRKIHYLNPLIKLEKIKANIIQKYADLRSNMIQNIKMSRKGLEIISNKLDALSPLLVLKRGYSISQKTKTNQIIRNVKDLSQGEEVSVRVHEGSFTSIVKEIKN